MQRNIEKPKHATTSHFCRNSVRNKNSYVVNENKIKLLQQFPLGAIHK